MTTTNIPRPAFLDDPALRAVLHALPRSRVIGGAVRDTIAGRPLSDIDLATPEPPDQVAAALLAAGLKHAPTGLQHGTLTAISQGQGFEVTTLRRDDVTDGRHAEVSWTSDWQEDAARRDFTINALSMQPDGTIFDYFQGREDLEAGRVRFVGDPPRRIAEDYLRILRFFRFQGRYGAQHPDAATLDALRAGVQGLARLSVERVWSELKRILLVPAALRTLRLMADLGVLDAVLPGGTDLAHFGRLVQSAAPADPLLRLAALQPGTAAAARLKLSNADASALEALAGPPPDPAWDDAALRRAMADTPPTVWLARAWLAPALLAGTGDPAHRQAWATLRHRLTAERPVFPLAGRDVVALGVPMGPRVGTTLAAVRTWWMEGGCTADASACRARLHHELATTPPP